jgi:hypothetical protein
MKRIATTRLVKSPTETYDKFFDRCDKRLPEFNYFYVFRTKDFIDINYYIND